MEHPIRRILPLFPAYGSLSAGQRSSGRITRSTFPICSESRSKSRRTSSGIGVLVSESQSASISRATPNSDASINSSAERAWSSVNRPANKMIRPRRRPVRSECVAKSKTKSLARQTHDGHAASSQASMMSPQRGHGPEGPRGAPRRGSLRPPDRGRRTALVLARSSAPTDTGTESRGRFDEWADSQHSYVESRSIYSEAG